MTDDQYEGVPFHRWQTDAIAHMRELHRRNELLQAALDAAIGREAALQMELATARQAAVRQPRVPKVREPPVVMPEDLNLERVKVRYVREALSRHDMLSEAAKALGIDRTTLYKCIENYGLSRKATGRMRPQQRKAS